MKTLTFQQSEPERLDAVVTRGLNLTRSQIQKHITSGKILVNGAMANSRTRVDDSMTITYDPTILTVPEKTGVLPSFDVLFENSDVLVINKPAGVLVHDAEGSREFTLVDALIKQEPQIADVGDKQERAGLVHRLDKFTSGVMIVAKTQEAFEHLKSQFKNRLTEKHYTALVMGQLSEPSGTIDFPIERSKNTGRMAARSHVEGGRSAITHYDTIKAYPHHTLLDVNIETGRTHQIRVHFFAIDHPVVGDTLYRQRGVKPMNIPTEGRAGGRLFLHARSLSITLPDGERKTFEAPLPKELERVLEEIPKL